MIYGIGVDSVSIGRIENSIGRPHFVGRVFSQREQALIEATGPKQAAQKAAGCFAAKEAFLKAAGVGLGGFSLPDIAALRRPGGAPYIEASGTAGQFLKTEELVAHLSLTNEGGFATAFVVLERRGGQRDVKL